MSLEKILEPEVRNSESFRPTDTRVSHDGSVAQAKSELLHDLDREQRKVRNISAQSLIWVYILLFFTLLFIMPKIYIANQIYYISKDINTKYHKYTALLEENRHLKKEIERLQYQRSVVDPVEIP